MIAATVAPDLAHSAPPPARELGAAMRAASRRRLAAAACRRLAGLVASSLPLDVHGRLKAAAATAVGATRAATAPPVWPMPNLTP